MSRAFEDFSKELSTEWSDDVRRAHDAAAREFAADIAARRALGRPGSPRCNWRRWHLSSRPRSAASNAATPIPLSARWLASPRPRVRG